MDAVLGYSRGLPYYGHECYQKILGVLSGETPGIPCSNFFCEKKREPFVNSNIFRMLSQTIMAWCRHQKTRIRKPYSSGKSV